VLFVNVVRISEGYEGFEQSRESGILKDFNSLRSSAVMHMWLGCLVMWYWCYGIVCI